MADMYEAPKEVRQRANQSLAKKFYLYNALSESNLSYSYGMRQKIVIIGVLMSQNEKWILDEPLTGLEPEIRIYFKRNDERTCG